MKYDTKQKHHIINCLKDINIALSVKEITQVLNDANLNVGTTTIYRCLNELENEKKLKKVVDNNEAKYVFLGDCFYEHIHMICKKCGGLSHIEIENIELIEDVELDLFESSLVGLCKNCKKE